MAAAHSHVTALYGNEGKPARYSLYIGFSLGSLLGPILCQPFISGVRGFAKSESVTSEPVEVDATTATALNTTLADDNSTLSSAVSSYIYQIIYSASWDQSSIEYPYVMVFSVGIFIAAAFLVSFWASVFTGNLSRIHGSYSTNERCAAILLPKNWALGNGFVGSLVPVMTFVAVILQSLLNYSTDNYMAQFALDSNIGFTASNIWLVTVLSICGGLFGRAAGALCARYIPMGYILLFAAAGQSLMTLLCLVMGSKLMNTMLALVFGLCFFRDAIIPTLYAWSSHYVLLYGVVVGVAEMCAQLATVVFMPMMDQLYNDVTIRTVFTSAIVFAVVLFILTWFMIWFGKANYSYDKNMKKIFASFHLESIDITNSYVKCQEVQPLDSSHSTF